MKLIEGRRSSVDLFIPGAEGLGLAEVEVRTKRLGATEWKRKELTPGNWQEAGGCAYLLTLDPDEVELPGVAVLVSRRIDGVQRSALHSFEVEEAALRPGAGSVPRTILCGYVVTLDQRGKAKAAVIARVAQSPLLVGGVGVSNEQISAETDESGYFELSVVTGAVVHVQVPALQYTKQFIVPPPPAPGIPVRLFSL